MPEANEALFRQAVEGDREAFWRLVLPHRGIVYSVALAVLRDPERAEDLLHEVLITAFGSLSNLRDPAKLPSWLHSLTRNHALEVIRRETRSRRGILSSGRELTRVVPMSELVEKEKWLTHMETAIDRLPEPFRVILSMKYMNDYSCRDIAEIMDISESAVKSRLFQARKLLRTLTDKVASESGEANHELP